MICLVSIVNIDFIMRNTKINRLSIIYSIDSLILTAKGIYVIGFSYPVVPKDQARIRVQISAAHTEEDIDRTVAAFIEVGKSRNVI